MPKVTGPLFSIAASGSVAKLLTFRDTRHGPVVQRTPQHFDSHSQWQLYERQSMRNAAAAWHALDGNTRAIWGNNALPTVRTGYMSFFMEWKAQNVPAGSTPLIPSHYVGIRSPLPWRSGPQWDDAGSYWDNGAAAWDL